MISIFTTTDQKSAVEEIIKREDRLDELISYHDTEEVGRCDNVFALKVETSGITVLPDWNESNPPYLLPRNLPLKEEILLGLIFDALKNTSKSKYYLNQWGDLEADLNMRHKLRYSYAIEEFEINWDKIKAGTTDLYEKYRYLHNTGVVCHYGYLKHKSVLDAEKYYVEALDTAPDNYYRSFTTKHYATLLVDAGDPIRAIDLLKRSLEKCDDEYIKYNLNPLLISAMMSQASLSSDPDWMEDLKGKIWGCIRHFEKKNLRVETAFQYLNALQITNLEQNFAEGLGYANRAMTLFAEEELPELIAEVNMEKGNLLYSWAQSGNPQFFKPAIEAYQESLKIFSKSFAPDIFAKIHHQLAVIYASMPADRRKKSVLAGLAVSSFHESLEFYKKKKYPYEYAMICNDYGNALMKFPPAVHTDHFEKALFYYQEALGIRSDAFPLERTITLLNYLEASWQVGNSSDSLNKKRFDDMVRKAQEIKNLVDDPELINEADRHLKMLDVLNKRTG